MSKLTTVDLIFSACKQQMQDIISRGQSGMGGMDMGGSGGGGGGGGGGMRGGYRGKTCHP